MQRLFRVCLFVVALAVASSATAADSLIPTFTQHQIAKRAPALAYVPARVATGYRYHHWTYSGGVLRIWLRNKAQHDIVFVAAKQQGPCTAGREKTFQMGGNKVYWSQSANEQQAWRCVGGVRLIASTVQPPTTFADVGLGQVAASGHKIR